MIDARSTVKLARPPIWDMALIETEPGLSEALACFADWTETIHADEEARVVREAMIVLRPWGRACHAEDWQRREKQVSALLNEARPASAVAALLPQGVSWEAQIGDDGCCQAQIAGPAIPRGVVARGQTVALALAAALYRTIAGHCLLSPAKG